MSRTPSNLPGACGTARLSPRGVSSNVRPRPAGPWRRLARFIAHALPLAAVLAAGAAHAVPQVSSLVHAPDILPAGGTVTSTVTIAETDSLPITAPGASFTFTIPANAVYMGTDAVPVGSCTSDVPVGSAGQGTLTCSGITLGANERRDFKVLLRTTQQGTLSVTAAPTGGGSGETKIITVNQGADVGVSIAAPATAPSGATVPIVFTLVNNGPDASSGSTLTYPIPSGLSLSGGLPAGCSKDTIRLLCDVASIAVNGTRVITVNGTVTAAATSTVTHQAAVAPVGAIGDGVSANNNATANTTVTTGYVLALSKTHDGGQLLVGQRFNFRLSPRFSGTPPTGVTLSDTLPANFTIQPFTAVGGWSCSVAGQTVSCARTDIGGSGDADVALGDIVIPVVASSAGTGIVNQATVSATGPIANSATGSVPADVVVSATDFRADKRRSWPQDNVPLGQAFDYQVGSTNLGSTRLLAGSTVQLVDQLPVGVQINSVAERDGYTCAVTKGGATVVPTPGTPVPGPATVTCQRTLTADIGVDTSSGNGARNGGYVIVNATIPAATGGPVVNSMCVNVALPVAAPTLGTDPDANTGNDCVSLGTGSNDGATAADVQGAQARGGHRRQRGQPPGRGPGRHLADRGGQRRPLRGAERGRHRQLRAGDRRRHRHAGGQRRHLRGHLRAAGQRRRLRRDLAVGLHAVHAARVPRQHRARERAAAVPGHPGRRQALRRRRLGHRPRLPDRQHRARRGRHAGRPQPGQQRRQHHRLPAGAHGPDGDQVGQPDALGAGGPAAHLHADGHQPQRAGQPEPRLRRRGGRHLAGQPDVPRGGPLRRRQLRHDAIEDAAHGRRQRPAQVHLGLARPQRAADRHGARAAAVCAAGTTGRDQQRGREDGNARARQDQQRRQRHDPGHRAGVRPGRHQARRRRPGERGRRRRLHDHRVEQRRLDRRRRAPGRHPAAAPAERRGRAHAGVGDRARRRDFHAGPRHGDRRGRRADHLRHSAAGRQRPRLDRRARFAAVPRGAQGRVAGHLPEQRQGRLRPGRAERLRLAAGQQHGGREHHVPLQGRRAGGLQGRRIDRHRHAAGDCLVFADLRLARAAAQQRPRPRGDHQLHRHAALAAGADGHAGVHRHGRQLHPRRAHLHGRRGRHEP
jgi:uncharacterized repeat protein (TIGR01451 family)